MHDDDHHAARRAARAHWPGAVLPAQTPAQLDTAEARVLSMWQLALDAWAAQGLELPSYTRETMPGRLWHRD